MPWRGSKRSSADMMSIYWTHLLHRVDRGDDRAMPSSSDTYLHGHHDSLLRSHRWRTAENSAGYLLPRLPPDPRALPVGCGPGTVPARMAARGALGAAARQAGFAAVEASGSAWCYTGDADRVWWGASWADRLTKSPFGDRAVEHGLATRDDLERLAQAWLRWADSEDAWILIPHGEILARA